MAQASESQPVCLDEALRFGGIGQAGVAFLDFDVFLHAAQHAQFGLDADPLGVGAVHDALGDRDVLVERIMRGVNHHRTEKAGINALVAGLFVAVIQMHGEDGFREDLLGGADDGFEHALVGVFPGAFRDLDDERRLAVQAAFEQTHGLLGVVDVVGADGELAVGDLEELGSGDDHIIFLVRGFLCG